MAGGNDNTYRMLVLLEEPLEEFETFDHKTDEVKEVTDAKVKEQKKSHEFVEELLLPFQVDELELLNKWFDKFDEEICIPNEGNIKYEISSDGLIVLMIDKEIEDVVAKVKSFVVENQDLEE